MVIHKDYPCNVDNYQRGRAQPVSFLVFHYVGATGGAEANAKYYGRTPGIGASAHYFVDRNAVMQSVDEGDTAWHCGSDHPRHPYCRNSNSIGIEMCDSVEGVPEDVRSLTVSLVQELMSRYGIDSSHVLRHYDVTGKRCPARVVDNPVAWVELKSVLWGEDGGGQMALPAECEPNGEPIPKWYTGGAWKGVRSYYNGASGKLAV